MRNPAARSASSSARRASAASPALMLETFLKLTETAPGPVFALILRARSRAGPDQSLAPAAAVEKKSAAQRKAAKRDRLRSLPMEECRGLYVVSRDGRGTAHLPPLPAGTGWPVATGQAIRLDLGAGNWELLRIPCFILTGGLVCAHRAQHVVGEEELSVGGDHHDLQLVAEPF